MDYNYTLEELVDLLYINIFDNEIMVEKYFIYVSQLINSYVKTLKIQTYCKEEDQTQIKGKIKNYFDVFIKKSLNYLNIIIENELKSLNEDKELKKIFFEIILFVVEKINELAKECLQKRAKFCQYYSLIYCEKGEYFFSKYIGKPGNLSICDQKLVSKAEEINKRNQMYIKDINSRAILFFYEVLESDKLIFSNKTGYTICFCVLKYNKDEEEEEKCQIILSNSDLLSWAMSGEESIPSEQKKKAAKYIANIIKLSINFLGNFNYQRYIELRKQFRIFEND